MNEKDELYYVDIADALRDMSQWTWLNERDLRRNLIAKEARKEIIRLRAEVRRLEQKPNET